ncbi:ribonuclease T [Leucothrix mucor]|jgi:ribonuclease T|uniref:ribonuclease T n=1 Tax=Leucothrix mucor TaxID=45248 RepID=UPI0003B73FF9|nr:ribonuclease T [Leucothrix mucor]
MTEESQIYPLAGRFRGFLPVVIDLETGGFNHKTDALLEMAAVFIRRDANGDLYRWKTLNWHIEPFEGANMDPKSLEVNGIDPFQPFRQQIAVDESIAINQMFKATREEIKLNECNRAVLVGHNAAFDLNFLNATVERLKQKRNPFHPFSTFDTVTLAAMAFEQTVLARSVKKAGFDWDGTQAHSAMYDAEKTADLFCHVMNKWRQYVPSLEE